MSSGATWVLTGRNPSATVSQAPSTARCRGTTTFGVSGWFLGRAAPHASLRNPHRPGVRRPRAARPRRRAGVQDPVADLRGAARPRGPVDPRRRPSTTSRRSACTRCASCSTGTTSRPSPTRASSPTFDETDPASYDWRAYDAVVDGIKARGWNLLLTVSGPVPRWATNGARDNAHAPEPGGVPDVRHRRRPPLRHEGRHLVRSGTSPTSRSSCCRSTRRTRRRCRRASTATCSSPPSAGWPTPASPHARVLIGETSPRGTGKVVAPLTFLRGALCLDSKYHKTSKGCAKLARRRLRPPRLHHGSGPDVQAQAAQRRDDRRPRPADHGARPRRQGGGDHVARCRST